LDTKIVLPAGVSFPDGNHLPPAEFIKDKKEASP